MFSSDSTRQSALEGDVRSRDPDLLHVSEVDRLHDVQTVDLVPWQEHRTGVGGTQGPTVNRASPTGGASRQTATMRTDSGRRPLGSA